MYTQRNNQPQPDLYQRVTQYVIDSIEKGTPLWRKPWGNRKISVENLPQNLTTRTPYRGWNRLLLAYDCYRSEFTSPFFVTFKQAQQLGGRIKKGSHGIPIINYVEAKEKSPTTEDATGAEESSGRARRYPVAHTIFNVEQTEGIDYPTIEPEVLAPIERIAACEKFLAQMPQPAPVRHGYPKAEYYPVSDHIQMPPIEDFSPTEQYYSTLFHEIIHSTGHQSRLNRKELMDYAAFGSVTYGKEELTAEMGAAFLCAQCGIEQKTIDNSAAYLQSWLNTIKKDKRMILSAAAKAQAAVDFLLPVPQTPTIAG